MMTTAELHAVAEEVARATAELIAEEYDSPAEIWAEREQIAEQIAHAAVECEAEEPRWTKL